MLKLYWVTKHVKILENKAMNKVINDAHDLSLLLTEHQCIEIMIRLMLINLLLN